MKDFLCAYMAKMGVDGKNPMAPFQNGQHLSPVTPGFPWHSAYSGDLDLTGFRKSSSYYRDILWNGGDPVFTAVRFPYPNGNRIVAIAWVLHPTLRSWTWPGQEGKQLTVEVYSGAERVRLYLKDKLISEKLTGREQQFKTEFEVPYITGVLNAVELRGDRIVAENILQTRGDTVRLNLTADRSSLAADCQNLAFIAIEATDAKGHLPSSTKQKVHFTLSAADSITAVVYGDGEAMGSYAGDAFNLFQGRAFIVLRTTHHPGQFDLTAHSDGLTESSIVADTKQTTSISQLP